MHPWMRLSTMIEFAPPVLVNRRSMDTEIAGDDVGILTPTCHQLVVLFPCQLRPSHHGASRMRARPSGGATLLDTVIHVLSLGTNKQVRRSHAATVITLMADVQAIRNRTVRHFIREAMGQSWYLSNRQCSIAIGKQGAIPEPALTGGINPSPESLGKRNPLCLVVTGSGAVFRLARRVVRECGAALETGILGAHRDLLNRSGVRPGAVAAVARHSRVPSSFYQIPSQFSSRGGVL